MMSPFPYFGGKQRVANIIWDAFGRAPRDGGVRHYIEPFAGSLATLLHADAGRRETVNDADGLLANFWRATKLHPDAVAEWADWPVNEADLHARHLWLVGQREALTDRLMADPDWCDPKAAGWWVWGASAWIGSGWCSGEGPWVARDGLFVRRGDADDSDAGMGVQRQLPHLGSSGMGINRQLPHLTRGRGVNRKLPHLGDNGRGINRKLPHLGNSGRGEYIRDTMRALSERLRDVRVACGDWSRVCGPSVLGAAGAPVGILLDPPYLHTTDAGSRDPGCYAVDSAAVAHDVREWAIAVGADRNMRVILCGYEGEHVMPDDWREVKWKARGGYGSQGDGDGKVNASRERLWLSPGCLTAGAERQGSLL